MPIIGDYAIQYPNDDEFYNTEEWDELREEVLARDEYCCVICGSTEYLQVHHIVPRRYKFICGFDIDKIENLITMCLKHHELADRKYTVTGKKIKYGRPKRPQKRWK